MRKKKPSENPFPISATVYRQNDTLVVGLLSFGSLYSLAGLKDVHCIVLHDIARTTDPDNVVADVMSSLLKHLEVCLRVKGLKLVGYELELTTGDYDLRAVIESQVQAA